MTILAAFFGFFALMSLIALVKFQGNVIFVFSLLLSAASLVWILNLERGGRRAAARASRRPKPRRPRR